MLRRTVPAVLLAVLCGGLLFAQAKVAPRTAERAFSPGGHVWMELSAGDYDIRAGRDDRVWVELRTPDPDDIASCKATIEQKGRDLLIATTGPRGGMHATVEVPTLTDLNVRLSAGDLRVRGIRGSKDVSSWAGNVDVEVGSRNDYQKVHASVSAGDLSARPFDISKGGLFRSFSWKGPGRLTLDVRLTAGDLTLR